MLCSNISFLSGQCIFLFVFTHQIFCEFFANHQFGQSSPSELGLLCSTWKHGSIKIPVSTSFPPPSCTTGSHSYVHHQHFYVNTSHGAWCGYNKFSCYTSASNSDNFADDDGADDDPWWFSLPSYFFCLRDMIQQFWRVEVHLCWWNCLKHQLNLLSVWLW